MGDEPDVAAGQPAVVEIRRTKASSSFKSRWVVSLVLMAVALLVLVQAGKGTSGEDEDTVPTAATTNQNNPMVMTRNFVQEPPQEAKAALMMTKEEEQLDMEKEQLEMEHELDLYEAALEEAEKKQKADEAQIRSQKKKSSTSSNKQQAVVVKEAAKRFAAEEKLLDEQEDLLLAEEKAMAEEQEMQVQSHREIMEDKDKKKDDDKKKDGDKKGDDKKKDGDKKDEGESKEEEKTKPPLEQIPTIPAATQQEKIKAFKQGTRPKIPYQYKTRSTIDNNPAINKKRRDDTRNQLAKKFGSWTLVDNKAKDRPKEDFAKKFPSRDIPWNKFPDKAWQVDKDYLGKFLPEAIALVERAQEAILKEYGWGKEELPKLSLEERMFGTAEQRHSFFTPIVNITDIKDFRFGQELGGFISEKYFNGLIRRTMHAIITGDTFTMVMGGHSAAAGHGNHFQQSYTLQFHKILEPVFARFGVKLNTHNVGFGGLGTLQSSLGSGDLYGREIDLLVWDSSMTEKSNEAYDFYARQAIMAGNRVPVLMGGMPEVLKNLDADIDAEVGVFGAGGGGVTEITDADMAKNVPYAARYLRCTGETRGLCREMEYNGTCWIDRDDYTPETKQNPEPGGRASWHPGFRQHGVRGRIIAMSVLRALKEGLKQWDEAPEKKLPVEVWHVDKHYKTLKEKLKEMKEDRVWCMKWKDVDPKKILCHTPMRAVSEMTPRVFPKDTSILHIMKAAPDGYKPEPNGYVYKPPDVFNAQMETPDGVFDYLAAVENGVDYPEFMAFDNSPLPPFAQPTGNKVVELNKPEIKPGKGWGIAVPGNPDGCDGSYDGFCNRGPGNNCLLYGHNDNRGGVSFTSFSGWGVFTVPNVKEGVIFLRVEWWHRGNAHERTNKWEKENDGDEAYSRRLSEEEYENEAHGDDSDNQDEPVDESYYTDQDYTKRLLEFEDLNEPYWVDEHTQLNYMNVTESARSRRLGAPPVHRRLKGEELCNEAKFQYAVNGKITTYNKAQFHENLHIFQRVVQIITVLNNPKLTDGEEKDVEIAVRFTGCGHKNLLMISGIYWA